MLDIDGLMANLADTRKMFHSEADFQHALAWQIHEAAPESQVRLEVSVVPVETQRMFLDIWLPVERIAIELKYVTRRLELVHNQESFALRDHSAQDQRRYDFLLDIQRLELMRSMPELCKAGHAVLLTNDSSYWNVPRSRDTVDSDFRIHEGRAISGELAWAARPAFGRSSMPAASRVCAMVWSIGSSCCTSLASWVTPTATMICSSLTTAWAL